MKYRPIFTKLIFQRQLFVENYKDLNEIPINNLVAYARSQADRLTKREKERLNRWTEVGGLRIRKYYFVDFFL